MASQDSPATLHYVDPPYVHDTRSEGHGYRFEMDDQQHENLTRFLGNMQGSVIISGYQHPIYDRMGWVSRAIEAKTFHKGNVGSPRTEMLWLNAQAADAQAQRELFAHRTDS